MAGAGGTTYGIYNAMQPAPEKIKSYSEALKGALLSTDGTNNQTKWEARLASIKELQDANSLVNDLKEIKSKKNPEANWKDLKDWCVRIINNKNKGGQEFENVQNYCTFSIKEKITNAVDISTTSNDDTKWNAAYDKLQKIDDGLDDDLIVAKAKKDPKKYEGVKEWCTKAYKKPYKGKDDKDFKNASRICVSK